METYQLKEVFSRAICYTDNPQGILIIISQYSFTNNQ